MTIEKSLTHFRYNNYRSIENRARVSGTTSISVFAETSFGQGWDSNGFDCISCTEYQKCDTGSSEGPIISCRNGKNCTDVHLKQRQPKLNSYALNECTQAGIFPDVMIDSNYYVCLGDASSGFLKYEFSCPEGNFFDQSSVTCVPRSVTSSTSDNPTSTVTATDPSSSKVSTDTTLSSSATDLTSSSLVTEPSTPNIPTDTTLSLSSTESTFTSTSPSTLTNPSTLSTSTPSIVTSSSTQITSPSISTNPSSSTIAPTISPFVCTAPGIFSNPSNCKMYYRCSTSLKAFFYICPGNSYFNENILKCSLIITPICQEQILKNSSSVSPPVTTPTITPATAKTTFKPTIIFPSTTNSSTTTITTPFIRSSSIISPIFTTSTQATTVNSPPTTSVLCTTAGTFANPLDCKTYYRCSLSGKIFRYICPGNTYFNEIMQRCSLVITARCKSLI